MGGILEEQACELLLTRLGAPNRHTTTALLVARHAPALRLWRLKELSDLYAAFAAIAKTKPEEARGELIRVFAKVADIDLGEFSERMFQFDAIRPDKSEIAATNGKEFGQQLKQARLALIKNWLRE